MPREAVKAKTARPRREEVLNAARRLFFRQGYRGTTVQQIATQAGYSKRTVYLDYLNKDELFITLCAEGGQLLLDDLARIPAAELTVEECVHEFVDVCVGFARGQHEYFRMIFSEATPAIIGNCSEQLRKRVEELERTVLGLLVAWAQRAIDQQLIEPHHPWDIVGILVGGVAGITMLSMGGSQTVFASRSGESLVMLAVDIFWRGLRKNTAGRQRETGGVNGRGTVAKDPPTDPRT